ncbi:hypothetical protein D3C81_1648220 [compost metagenome]
MPSGMAISEAMAKPVITVYRLVRICLKKVGLPVYGRTVTLASGSLARRSALRASWRW